MKLEVGNKCLYQSPSHLYLACDPRLRPYIAHYTICFPRHTVPTLFLVPDVSGCIVMQEHDAALHTVFWGPTTRCVQVGQNPEDKPLYFVEFRPAGAYAFFQCPQMELQDQRIAMEQLNAVMESELANIYEESSTIEDWVCRLDAMFLSHLSQGECLVQDIVQQIARGNTLEHIFHAVGYSQRHTQRIVKEQLGCSMKTIQKIQRINMAVKLIQQKQHSMTEIAAICGYFDQAHFIHDFHTVCSRTPGQYQKELSLFYNEAFKF